MDPFLAEISKYRNCAPKEEEEEEEDPLNNIYLLRIGEVRTSFPDHELLSEPGVLLQRLDPESIAVIGRSCLPMMHSGFTRQGVASIFLLAYNLRFLSPRKRWEPVFYDESVENRIEDKAYSTFSSTSMGNHGVYREISPSNNVELEAVFYSYIATSLLRLFSKPFESYIRSWNQIVSGFSRFYNVNPPVNLAAPSGESIKLLAIVLGNRPIYKASLFKLLYAGGGDRNKASGLKRFLYDNYLPNTGLHIIELFFKLSRVLNCSPEKLLASIDNGDRLRREKKCLESVIDLMVSDQEDHKRKMWMYGRIFDEKFMADIATKKCPGLVYALAIALKDVAPGENDGIFNIVQLRDIGNFQKMWGEKFGKTIVKRALSSE